MKKSLLSLALAGSMLSALAVPAFAATPSDVVGKPVQSAVERLSALGILQGYADGTFKPDNSITRAELAKIIVVATGNESAAQLMANTAPTFKDVKAGAWYTGYINVAATKGFIQGYNGKFRPNDTVKFEEATAILVRALGYQDKYLSGSWPYNVLLQANELGIFDGVDIAKGANANRGTVAELTDNTLGQHIVNYNTDKLAYDVTSATLIEKVGYNESAVVTAAAFDANGKLTLNTGAKTLDKNFFITDGKKLADLLGHTVKVLYTKDKTKVLALTDAQEATRVVTVTANAAVSGVKANSTFKLNGVTYATAAGTTAAPFNVYDNTDAVQTATYDIKNGASVQLFLNADGTQVQAVVVDNWDANQVVKSITNYTSYSKILTQANKTFKVDSTTSVILDGKVAKIADLKENDAINVVESTKTGVATKVEATRKVVTGKLEAVGKDGSDTTYKVAGTTYLYKGLTTAADVTKVGTEYTYVLNKDNQVVYAYTASAVDNSQYAVIYDVDDNGGKLYSVISNGVVVNDNIKVVYYALNDKQVHTVYTTHLENFDDATKAGVDYNYLDGALVKLAFNSNDSLIDLSAGLDSTPIKGVAVTSVSSSLLTAGSNYILDGNTTYLKVALNGTNTTVTAATAADVTTGTQVAVKATAGKANYVIITSVGSTATLPTVQGLYQGLSKVETSATSASYGVKIKKDGETKTYAVSKDVYTYFETAALKTNDIVQLVDNLTTESVYDGLPAAGKELFVKQNAYATTLDAVDTDAKTFTINTNVKFVETSNTRYYLVDGDTISDAGITDVLDAKDGFGTTEGKYQIVVQDTGTDYGTYNEAGVVLIVKQHPAS